MPAAGGPGDTIANVNTTAIDQMSDASAHATLVDAMTQKDINATVGGSGGTVELLPFRTSSA